MYVNPKVESTGDGSASSGPIRRLGVPRVLRAHVPSSDAGRAFLRLARRTAEVQSLKLVRTSASAGNAGTVQQNAVYETRAHMLICRQVRELLSDMTESNRLNAQQYMANGASLRSVDGSEALNNGA